MDFNLEERLATTKAIIEVTDSSGSLGFAQDRKEERRFEDNARYSMTKSDATS